MDTLIAIAVGMLILVGAAAAQPPAQQQQPGLGEQIGEQLDRGVEELGRQLQRGWAGVRDTVNRLGLQGRVYARIHWDRALGEAPIDIEIQDNNTVVLTGKVQTEAARSKAVQLAQDTIGVQKVVDRLAVAPPPPRPHDPPEPYSPRAGDE